MEIHRVGEKMSFSSDWSSLRNGNHQLQQELFHKLCICKYYLLCLHCKFLQVGITYHGETNYSPDWESQKVFWAICIILVNVVKIIISIVIIVVIIIVLLSMAQITVAIINQEPVELVFRIGMANGHADSATCANMRIGLSLNRQFSNFAISPHFLVD